MASLYKDPYDLYLPTLNAILSIVDMLQPFLSNRYTYGCSKFNVDE